MIAFGPRSEGLAASARYPAPWRKRSDAWIQAGEWRAHIRDHYVIGETKVASNLEVSVGAFPGLRLGVWSVDDLSLSYGRDVEQLLEFAPDELVPAEDSLALGRGRYVDQYQHWLRAGLQAPPVRVVQTEGGTLRVVDGNRRWLAHQREHKRIRAWVSFTTPTGIFDTRGKAIVTGMTWETSAQDAIAAGKRVSWRVRDEYGRVLARKPELARRGQGLYG